MDTTPATIFALERSNVTALSRQPVAADVPRRSFHHHVIADLSNGLSERSYNLVVARTPPDHLQDSLVTRNRGTDGLCLMLSGSAATQCRCIEHLTALGEPAIEERVRGLRDAIRKWPQPMTFATLECGDEHYPETHAALDAYKETRTAAGDPCR